MNERLALKLVDYLISLPVQREYAIGEEVFLPTRLEALDILATLPDAGSGINRTVAYSLQTGRAYPTMPLWSKIEHRFSQTLNQIAQDVLGGAEVTTTIQKHLDLLADRLENTLKGI